MFDIGLLDHGGDMWSDIAELPSQDSLLDVLVESVLDLIIVASFDKVGHLFPLATKLLVQFDEFEVLLLRPLIFYDIWVGLVQPALTALPRQTTRHLVCDFLPLYHLVRVAHDGFAEHFVFRGRPSNFANLDLVRQLQVPVVTFDHRLEHVLADQSPLIHAVLGHQVQELFIFFQGPHGELPGVVALGGSLANALRSDFSLAVTSCSSVLFIIDCLHFEIFLCFMSFLIYFNLKSNWPPFYLRCTNKLNEST